MDNDTAPDVDSAGAHRTARSYSLAEVAAMYLPPEWNGVRWLTRRLNKGEICGYRVGRTWRMTAEDVTAFINSRRNKPVTTSTSLFTQTRKIGAEVAAPVADCEQAEPPASIIDGLSPRSRARLIRRT